MPSNTQPNTAQTGAMTKEEMQKLFDALMEQIEPELMSTNSHDMDFVYAGETEEEHQVRMQRYEKAFALLEERLKKVIGTWGQELQDYRRTVLKNAKVSSLAEDTNAANSIAASIDNL